MFFFSYIHNFSFKTIYTSIIVLLIKLYILYISICIITSEKKIVIKQMFHTHSRDNSYIITKSEDNSSSFATYHRTHRT